MTAEKSRDEYMREATQLLNHGDQAAAEGGEISTSTKELLLLTRGMPYRSFQLSLSSWDVRSHSPASKSINGRCAPLIRGSAKGKAYKLDCSTWKGASLGP